MASPLHRPQICWTKSRCCNHTRSSIKKPKEKVGRNQLPLTLHSYQVYLTKNLGKYFKSITINAEDNLVCVLNEVGMQHRHRLNVIFNCRLYHYLYGVDDNLFIRRFRTFVPIFKRHCDFLWSIQRPLSKNPDPVEGAKLMHKDRISKIIGVLHRLFPSEGFREILPEPFTYNEEDLFRAAPPNNGDDDAVLPQEQQQQEVVVEVAEVALPDDAPQEDLVNDILDDVVLEDEFDVNNLDEDGHNYERDDCNYILADMLNEFDFQPSAPAAPLDPHMDDIEGEMVDVSEEALDQLFRDVGLRNN